MALQPTQRVGKVKLLWWLVILTTVMAMLFAVFLTNSLARQELRQATKAKIAESVQAAQIQLADELSDQAEHWARDVELAAVLDQYDQARGERWLRTAVRGVSQSIWVFDFEGDIFLPESAAAPEMSAAERRQVEAGFAIQKWNLVGDAPTLRVVHPVGSRLDPSGWLMTEKSASTVILETITRQVPRSRNLELNTASKDVMPIELNVLQTMLEETETVRYAKKIGASSFLVTLDVPVTVFGLLPPGVATAGVVCLALIFVGLGLFGGMIQSRLRADMTTAIDALKIVGAGGDDEHVAAMSESEGARLPLAHAVHNRLVHDHIDRHQLTLEKDRFEQALAGIVKLAAIDPEEFSMFHRHLESLMADVQLLISKARDTGAEQVSEDDLAAVARFVAAIGQHGEVFHLTGISNEARRLAGLVRGALEGSGLSVDQVSYEFGLLRREVKRYVDLRHKYLGQDGQSTAMAALNPWQVRWLKSSAILTSTHLTSYATDPAVVDKLRDDSNRLLSSIGKVDLRRMIPHYERLLEAWVEPSGDPKPVLKLEADHDFLDPDEMIAVHGCLVPLLENCVRHGVETPAERQAQGKPEALEVLITLDERDGEINLSVWDDGRGVDQSDAVASRDYIEGGGLDLVRRSSLGHEPQVVSRAGGGFGVRVKVPVTPETAVPKHVLFDLRHTLRQEFPNEWYSPDEFSSELVALVRGQPNRVRDYVQSILATMRACDAGQIELSLRLTDFKIEGAGCYQVQIKAAGQGLIQALFRQAEFMIFCQTIIKTPGVHLQPNPANNSVDLFVANYLADDFIIPELYLFAHEGTTGLSLDTLTDAIASSHWLGRVRPVSSEKVVDRILESNQGLVLAAAVGDNEDVRQWFQVRQHTAMGGVMQVADLTLPAFRRSCSLPADLLLTEGPLDHLQLAAAWQVVMRSYLRRWTSTTAEQARQSA